MISISTLFKKRPGLAGIFSVALGSVLLLCGAGSTPTGNLMTSDVNGNGHSLTNLAAVTLPGSPGGCRIVCIGDSLTEGYTTGGLPGDFFGNYFGHSMSYPGDLQTLSFAANQNGSGGVFNLGLPGTGTATGAADYANGGVVTAVNLTSGSTAFTVTGSTTGIAVGQTVSGFMLPAGTTVATWSSPSGTLSQSTPVSWTGANLSFTTAGSSVVTTGSVTSGSNAFTVSGATTGVAVGKCVSGAGIPIGTTVATWSSPNGTLSQNATASGSGINLGFATGNAYDAYTGSLQLLSPRVSGFTNGYLLINYGTNDYLLGGVIATGGGVSLGGTTISGLTYDSTHSGSGTSIATTTGYNVFANGAQIGTVAAATSSSVTLSAGSPVALSGATIKLCPPPTAWESSYAALVSEALADHWNVVVLTLTPAYNNSTYGHGSYQENRLIYNTWLRTTYGNGATTGVTLIDQANLPNLQSTYPNYTAYYADQLHLSVQGYSYVANDINGQLSQFYATSLNDNPARWPFSRYGMNDGWLSPNIPTFSGLQAYSTSAPEAWFGDAAIQSYALNNDLITSNMFVGSGGWTLKNAGVGMIERLNSGEWQWETIPSNSAGYATNSMTKAMKLDGLNGTFAVGPWTSETVGNTSGANFIVDGPTGNTTIANGTLTISQLANGGVKVVSGVLTHDSNTYLTANQTITLSGDVTGSGATSISATVTKLNGTALSGLATGLLKNTTSTGVPTIAVAGTDYLTPGGSGALLTGIPTSVSNSDGTLTISPTTGAVVASLALGHANTWTAAQTINNSLTIAGNNSVIFGNASHPSQIQYGTTSQLTFIGGPSGCVFNNNTDSVNLLSFTNNGSLQFNVSGQGLLGTTTNDSANSGTVGEYVSSAVASGSAVSLTTATPTNVTSISLTAGDWDVEGHVNFALTGATVTGSSAGINTTSATIPTSGTESYSGLQTTTLTTTDSIGLTRKRISLATTTTVYLVGSATFSAGSVAGFGEMSARRVR